MKIAQITDLHLVKDKYKKINDINSFNSARLVVERISKNYGELEHLVVTGDISDDGSIESYNHLKEILKPIKSSIHLMPGNHDCIETLEIFRNTINIENQFYIENSHWLFFMFYTKKDDSPNGYIKDIELQTFKSTVKQKIQKNIIIFLHHHPVLIGSEAMDKMVIENASLLLNLIRNNSQVKGVFWGHIHNEFETKINNARMLSTPSTCFQSKPKSKTFKIDKSLTPGFRIIDLNDTGSFKTKVIRI